MPRTVNEGFLDFLPKLTATVTESEAAKRHRDSIKRCLENSFGLDAYFRAGSFGNGTNISRYSDVDFLACIPTDKLKQNSYTSLVVVRDALKETFPDTDIRVNSPAVKVPFGIYASETNEIVPADYVKETPDGYVIFEIADGNGGWMRTSPHAHNTYVRLCNDRLGGKVKPLIRFIKAWKYLNSVPISSFYLEMRVAKYSEGEQIISYAQDVYSVFKHLFDIDLASLTDPMGISGWIVPCTTDKKLEESKSKLATALVRAGKALEAAQAGNIKDAFYWWKLIYGEKFPNYYRD